MDAIRRRSGCDGILRVWDQYGIMLILDGMRTQIQIRCSASKCRSLDKSQATGPTTSNFGVLGIEITFAG